MVIRDARESDLSEIVAIYNTTIESRMVTADTEPVTVASRSTWFREHLAGAYPLWVIENDGQVAAWLSLQPFYGRPAYRATAEVSLYVAAELRRRAFGQRLLEAAIEQSPKLGLKTLLGFIFAHNEPSLRLFEKVGFERWGNLARVAEIDGREYDLVIVGRHVNAV